MTFDIKRRIIFPIIIVALSAMVALSIAELSLRALKIGYGNAPQESHSIFHHVHPTEYRFLSHTPTGEYGGHEVYYGKDRLVTNPNSNYPSDDIPICRVAFLGDSFTESVQVPYKSSFVGILEQNSNCAFKNYGTSSYSPIFYLLQWRKIVKIFRPTLVVVQLYSNDISSDKTYMKIAQKDENGEIIAIPGPGGGWITKQLRKSYLIRFLHKSQLQLRWTNENRGKKQDIIAGMVEENPDLSQLSTGLIETLAKEVRKTGAQFIFTVVPSKFRIVKNKVGNYPPEFSDKWKMFAHKHNIPFMDLTKPFEKKAAGGLKLFFDRDIHFNKNGHMIVASELSKTYPALFKPIQ